MRKKRQPWRPTTIRRFVRAIKSSACTTVVVTDAGPGYLKALGNPTGPHALASDWVGTQLAKWFGLSTFDFAIIPITEADEVPFDNGNKAVPGPAFITRAESGEPWSGKARQLRLLVNPEHISRLVVFDTWTLNWDRYSEPPAGSVGRPRENRNNVFLSEDVVPGKLRLKAMDHTHCFSPVAELSRRLRHLDTIREPRVFGLFPAFRKLLDRAQIARAAKDLRALKKTDVSRMTATIPAEWEVSPDVADALTELITERAAFVAATIEDRLWPQRDLGFGGPGSTRGKT